MRTRLAALIVALATVSAKAETKPTPGQKLALHAKPAVVRVEAYYLAQFSFNNKMWPTATGGEGSGFFISPDGYIATNAHVVDTIRAGDEKAYAKMKEQVLRDVIKAHETELRRMPEARARAILETIKLADVKKFNNVVLADGTKLSYDIKAFGAPLGGGDVLDISGKDVAIIKIAIKNAPTLPIGDSEKVQLQDRIYVIGYPGAADLRNLDQKSSLEPSITDGAISAIKQTRDGIPLLQHSAPTAPGNSGGPAVNERDEVLGIHSAGGMGEKAQGFNFVVGSATLLEFVRQSGAKPEQSETDRLWRESLELFWNQRYTAAIEKLQEVLSLFPAHREAKKLLDESRELKRQGKEKQDESRAGAIAGVVVALVVVVFGGLLVRRRLRVTAPPVRPAGPMPGSVPPGFAGAVQPRGPHPKVAATISAPLGGNMPGGVAATMFAGGLGTLRCTRGPLSGQEFNLTPQGVLVGRQPGLAQVIVDDGRVSARHVWIGWDQGALVAIDQGTKNGTFVNDISRGPIQRVPLKTGDVIIIAHPDCLSLTVRAG